ncbi:MAG: hypothetical protein ABI452_06820 [Candidatus Limnocylindrales bacterium]
MRRLGLSVGWSAAFVLVLACGAYPGASSSQAIPAATFDGSTTIPLCDDVAYLEAPAEWYRDSPIYVGNEMDGDIAAIRAWAARQPGYEDIWIDRSHLGWITVAFSVDAAARQAELTEGFPGVGVVAVAVDWTSAQLERLQLRIVDTFRGEVKGFSSGQYPNKGVVSIELPYLEARLVAIAEQNFAGQPVCLSGADPALAPIEGPQPTSGAGWRLLADQDRTGESYRTGIAYDEASYEELWRAARLGGDPPQVEFQTEVAIWFGAVHGSSCPRMRLDGVVMDGVRALVFANLTYLDAGACTADAIPHAYVIAVERPRLPHGPFAIQLDAAGPPGGATEERTVVDVDLSRPGSVAQPGEIHGDSSLPEPYVVGPGGVIETGFPALYRQSAHCGLEWLGPLNGVSWRTDVPDDALDWVPDEWRPAVVNQYITLSVIIETGDQPMLTATANDHSVIYRASAENRPGCD